MRLTVDDKLSEVPFDLADITLGKYLEYYEKFGRELDKQLSELDQKDYKKHLVSLGASAVTADDIELHKSIDLDNHLDREALSWFSFWTGVDLVHAKQTAGIVQLLSLYRIYRYTMVDIIQSKEAEYPSAIEWKDEVWAIQDFRINASSDMDFNEIITSKEVMRQIHSLGLGRWDALPYLCCVFLRKKGEAFKDELVAEGGDRLKLFQELPMLHALKVAFFLSISVSIWRALSPFSASEAPEEPNLN